MALSKRISAMRKERGWSRWELARVSGLNQPRVGDIESGATENPRLDTLQKLADAFGCSIDYLAHGREPKAGGPKKGDTVSVEVMAAQDPPMPEPPVPSNEMHHLAAEDYKVGRRLVRLYGKSMWPRYYPGDIVLMDANEKVQDGDVAVVRWASRIVVAEIASGSDGTIALKFAHPTWGSVEPGGSAKVIGKVIRRIEGPGDVADLDI